MSIQKIHESLLHSATADVDLSEKLHYFAKATATGYDLAGDGATVFGTIVEAAALGKAVTVQFGGIGKVIAAEAIAGSARIASDTNGKAVAAAVGDFEVGTTLPGATCAAGDVISFVFAPGRRHA